MEKEEVDLGQKSNTSNTKGWEKVQANNLDENKTEIKKRFGLKNGLVGTRTVRTKKKGQTKNEKAVWMKTKTIQTKKTLWTASIFTKMALMCCR